ncbi:signal peptidase I [Candidatus Uabimicrobium amorphum]|uniref:Signal peptidase I n=1 Tax=Uabimicrobium amorphum TaxID=2596890 RepID=A0A5S9IUE1_UABAM|nr:signal peptidase I [Candidatus Uabimicrobium amorphum]BBM86805.1 signal peptidase I [Candidatus Uabimicrobium amorphum]
MKLAEFITEIAIYGLIISLMIHHFCFQSFKVMTRSMEATLIGDPNCGDRILVKKYAYEFKKPKRWEAIVFFYPHNNQQIFIKRLIGLPGEKVHIRNGEIYINNILARKPSSVVNQLLYPVYQPQQPFKENWQYSEKWQIDKQQYSINTNKLEWCKYKHVVTNRYEPINNRRFFHRQQYAYPVGGGLRVGEIRFAIRFKMRSDTGSIRLELREGEYRFLCTIDTAQAGQLHKYIGEDDTKKQSVHFKANWQKNSWHSLVFSNIDDLVTLEIDSKEVAKLDYSQKQQQAQRITFDTAFRWGVSGSFELENAQLWRDIYYISKRDFFGGLTSFEVPNHHYFALGDNPPNSRDSKDWQRFCFFYKNGISIEGDQKNFPHGKTRKFTDIYGFDRDIPHENLLENYLSRQDAPFIPQSYIIGRAALVFWPITRGKIIY